jgi:hypothetical protein
VRAVAQLHGGAVLLQPAWPGLQAVLTLPIAVDNEREEVLGRRPAVAPPSENQNVAIGGLGGV